MKVFENIYLTVMQLAEHRLAVVYLYTLSFFESFILPFPPPDVLLAPMALKRPKKALYFALGTTIASVIGGVVGYLIGVHAFDIVEPFIVKWGYSEVLDSTKLMFDKWGFWAVLIAGFSPIPYKIFTISAGLLSLAFAPFLLASFIGRGLRFGMVAYILSRFGPSIEPVLMKYIERLGWAIIIIFISLVIYFKFI